MSSSRMNLSSDHSDSPDYPRDTPTNQEFVAESQTATPSEVARQEGVTSACEVIHATKVGLRKKKKKKTLVKMASLPSACEAAKNNTVVGLQAKEKQGKDPTIIKNSLPVSVDQPDLGHLREYFSIPSFVDMRLPSGADQVYRPLVARNVVDGPLSPGGMDERVPKVWVRLEKADRPKFPLTNEISVTLEKLKRVFKTAELPPRSSPSANIPSHPSPVLVQSDPAFFSLTAANLADELPSSSLPSKRPSEGGVSQGKQKQTKASFELSDEPKRSIPPTPFLAFDPLMAFGFYTTEFLSLPYTLPGGQQICKGTPFKNSLQSFHAMRPLLLEGLCEGYYQSPDPLEVYGAMCRHLIQAASAGFELARRADRFEEENKDLKAQAPSEKTASLEEDLTKVREELAESQQINALLNTKNKKLVEDYLGLPKKHEEVTSQQDKLKEESSGFDLQITQLSGYRDAAIAESSRATQVAKRLKDEVKRSEDAGNQHPKELWAAVENFKPSSEFENALSSDVERFKESPEFLDALGANAAYGVCSFVRKYKEKYPGLRSDYEEFQEGYNSSWFAELSLDAPFEDEEDEEQAPLVREAAP
ncbi:hypothetical protein LIER_38221 [Lithospermum erythrorhizon]|uniref:Uncharacterized protein n=1 Tax=Lithospermum erythrorhizon TaxID=34254 RepID=A0AAV3PXA2_LITER